MARRGEGGDVGAVGVCVVSLRAKETNHNATHELLDVLAAITPVSLVAANLTDDAALREEYEVVDVAAGGTGYLASSMAARFVRLQYRLCRAIAAREEGVVLFFGVTAYLLPVLFARLLGKTVVVEPRGDVPLTLRLRWEETMPGPVAAVLAGGVRLLERLSFLVSSAIITYTPAMAEELGLDAHAGKLYTAGARHVEVDRFATTVPYDERELLVGYVGRLDVEKGVDALVGVASRLSSDVGFVFVGDGSHRASMRSLLAEEVEAGRVEFTGWVPHDEVPEQLNRLRLLVMPSEPTEGLPTTILEAFACGTPAYATPVSGVPDVVVEGETGFLMTEDGPEAIAGRIEEIIEREDLTTISANARRLVEEEYDYEATVDRYREMLTRITQASTP